MCQYNGVDAPLFTVIAKALTVCQCSSPVGVLTIFFFALTAKIVFKLHA